MARQWDSCFEEAAQALAHIRRDLGHMDAHALRYIASERQAVLRSRATTHVWLAAVMERFTKAWIKGVCGEFSALGLVWGDVRISVFPMACGAELQSLSGGVKKDAWTKKLAMFQKTVDTTQAELDHAYAPLDGKTIRPKHLDDIWSIFGFAGSAFPSPIHKAVLNTVADYRNDLAHGDEVPAAIGAKLTYDDVIKYVGRFEDMVEHCCIASDSYFLAAGYRR